MDFERPKLLWDGSQPRSAQYDDVYFSSEGGLAETQAVFLEPNRLASRFENTAHTVIGELGFGTGLNFLATLSLFKRRSTAAANHRLTYISTEAHLLSAEACERAHAAFPQFAAAAKELRRPLPLTNKGFHSLSFENGACTLLILLGDAGKSLSDLEAAIDAWFLDGFAPSKNPAMWSQKIFEQRADTVSVA